MSIKDEAKLAALNLYPEDWQELPGGLKVDHNANVRAVAIEVFEHVFTALQSEKVAHGVSQAFLRRHEKWERDPRFIRANMATALMFAQLEIRG